MIIGEHNRENDLTVNVTREKHLTNMRTANKDQTATINKTKEMSLEESLEYISDDEYCEVTPVSIRLRKKILNQNEREKAAKNKSKTRSEEHTSELQSRGHLVCRLLLEK